MFTGLIECRGSIRSVTQGAASARLAIEARPLLDDLKIGDSVAVNGVCLTATTVDASGFTADVMHETLDRSSLGSLRAGDAVNLERAMPALGRFGGHIVSGHIDGTGRILSIRRDDNAHWYRVSAAPGLLRYIVEKGSITIDGISLTVAAVSARDFSVSVIPHTASVTTLSERRTGDIVNLECDVIGKYVEKLLCPAPETAETGRNVAGGISLEFLKNNGF